jgi:hypothetical protein
MSYQSNVFNTLGILIGAPASFARNEHLLGASSSNVANLPETLPRQLREHAYHYYAASIKMGSEDACDD